MPHFSAFASGGVRAVEYGHRVSKVDAQRAMREARFAERQAAARARPATAPAPATAASAAPRSVAKPAAKGLAAPAATAAAEQTSEPAACGHRNMGGKTCKRPAGHAEKNHRYS